jgi:uncharacterized protein YbaR (Trm112 family)
MRLQLQLTALASWVFLLWVLGLPFFFSKNYFYVGLLSSACAWTVVIAISLLLKCPQCKKNIVFVTKQSKLCLGPNWKALRKQFLPIEAVLGKASVIVCPHCGTHISVSGGLNSGT